eukprot:m.75463 g.75463  ORF g.75463 m.75463 type:complete len:405 (+) comp12452_c1_seq1:95-1309(+)
MGAIGKVYSWVLDHLVNPKHSGIAIAVILVVEVVLNYLIINYVPYTEIDWEAYMSEVEGYYNGTTDYTLLKGGTGPLVYPAGFVYFFLALYKITNLGQDVLLAQYIFAGFYLVLLTFVLAIFAKAKMPPYTMALVSLTAFRIHSIFVLRLFNDPIAMMFLYMAVWLFLARQWTIGCALFSLAVSIKMNVILFAPGLFIVLILNTGLPATIARIALCGAIQVGLGLPFLLENPAGYLQRSFDLGRQFMFKWTVNWRFLPLETFLDRRFHAILLGTQALLLLALLFKWAKAHNGVWAVLIGRSRAMLSDRDTLFILFSSNLVGIATARSLHYQFYVWYYHSIPLLLWFSPLPHILKFAVLLLLEFAWNTYPSTDISSAALHGAHIIAIVGVFLTKFPLQDTKPKIS